MEVSIHCWSWFKGSKLSFTDDTYITEPVKWMFVAVKSAVKRMFVAVKSALTEPVKRMFGTVKSALKEPVKRMFAAV